MSIEKLSDNSKVYAEKAPFTQILNDVISHIKDNDAFRMYCFLIAKSRDWVVVKEWTSKNCNVGDRKAKQCWSYLERCKLIEYVSIRDDQGKFIKHDMKVLIGSQFQKDEPFLKPTKPIGADSAPLDIHWCNNPPSGESTRVGFAPLLNKDLNQTKKELLQNKEKSFCNAKMLKAENNKRHEFAGSMNQMANEQKNIAVNDDFKKAPMPDNIKSLLGIRKKE